jgi:hypothetical protein
VGEIKRRNLSFSDTLVTVSFHEWPVAFHTVKYQSNTNNLECIPPRKYATGQVEGGHPSFWLKKVHCQLYHVKIHSKGQEVKRREYGLKSCDAFCLLQLQGMIFLYNCGTLEK